jgi:tRNA(fMet)-specific endonuclease VapC
LDTSAYSAFKRGHSDAVALLRKTPEILVPIIVLGELWSGFEFGSKREANRQELDAFLSSPRVSVVQVTLETAERYAVIYSFLRRNGRPIPTNDLWIAAMTMAHGATLLTADAHFLRLPQILVSHLAT